LIIGELCAKGSDNDIIEALEHLPRGLSELLNQKFARVQGMQSAREAIKVLQWCGVTRKALTTEEFREVLSISPGQNSLDRGNLPNDMNRIIADCCGLVFVEEEESTVHYVHHSVRKHLFAEHGPHSGQFNEVDVDKHFGYLCMTYLAFNDFKRQIEKVKQGSGPLPDPIKIGVGAITYPSSISHRLAQRLLRQRHLSQPLTSEELERKAKEILGTSEASRLESELKKRQFQFLDYARTYWIYHVTELDNVSHEKVWKLFCRCVDGNDVVAYQPWDTAEGQKHRGSSDRHNTASKIQWSLAHGHSALLLHQALYHSRSITEDTKKNIFHLAAVEGRYRYVEIITQYAENTNETLARALMDAAKEGCTPIILMLEAAGANVNAAIDGRIALQEAAGDGHLEAVERLLAFKADVNATADNGRTALRAAAGGGHLEVVERLLAAKADINTPAAMWGGRTALQAAAEGGHLKVVERLLAAKADANAPAGKWDGRTALQAAAEGGHLKVMERLLAAKADVNAPAGKWDGRTALQAAAGGGHLEVMERLLVAKADVNASASEDKGRTALQAAAEGGHLKVVERLLAAKADVNAPAGKWGGRTALQAAAEGGHLNVVERLLAANADVNASAAGQTALQAATEGGHLEVAERLMDAGAHK
jgi:ankyrin repeat protein